MADSKDSRSRDDERRRPRSRSASDSEEERRRQIRKAQRSRSPRDRRRDDHRQPRERRDTKDRRDRVRDDDRHRDSGSGSERRHRDKYHDSRRTHRDDDRHHESRHRRHREKFPRSPNPRSRERARDSRPRDEEPNEVEGYKKAAGPLPDQNAAFSVAQVSTGAMVPHTSDQVPEKQLPNFSPTGLLAAATNTVEKSDGSKVVLKYHEPPEARKSSPKDAWKLFIFKGADIVDTIPLAERSCWLIGRDVSVVDLPAEHPSVSKQHAVVQFRYVEEKNEYGDRLGKVKPYVIDLESANGTFLNGERIEESRFVEIRDKDLIKFGESTREYVVMLPPRE